MAGVRMRAPQTAFGRKIPQRFFIIVYFLCTFASDIDAQTDASEDDGVIVLPRVEISAERDTPETVSRDEMDRAGARDLWESVRDVPGVILTGGGSRNDSNFTVRGYGANSVPLYVDGVPVANPFRGEGDSARILAGDLESMEIKKGFSSQLFGANAMGGAVLMRIAKPKRPLELLLRTTADLDGLLKYGGVSTVVGAGSRQKLFYVAGTFQYRNTDHFRLSEKFEPHPGSIQGKGNRLWSDSEDMKMTFVAGLTPMPDLDIWTTYIYQDADKGVSPPDTGGSYAIWKWPFWRRHTVSLNSTYMAEKLSLSGLLYFDKYDNRLEEYFNKKAFDLGIHAPWSDYDEYSWGGRFTGEYTFTEAHSLSAACIWKLDDHRSLRGTVVSTDMNAVMHARELIPSGGVEYSGKPFQIPLTIKAGFGFDTLAPLQYWSADNEFAGLIQSGYYIAQSRNMLLYTWQAGLFWQIANAHEGRLTYARKNRFPTMSERYSTRFGTTLPNSNLGPEQANHFELGYRGSLFDNLLRVSAAAYYSIVRGKMTTVEIPNPENPNALTEYTFNLDSTSFYGFELAPELSVSEYFSMGMALSIMRYTLHHAEAGEQYLPYSPPLTVSGYMIIRPRLKAFSVIPRWEYISSRYGDTRGDAKLSEYFLLHLKINAALGSSVSASVSVNNILDAFYELRQYSPQEGRSVHFTMEYKY